jgi:hypothetical protein
MHRRVSGSTEDRSSGLQRASWGLGVHGVRPGYLHSEHPVRLVGFRKGPEQLLCPDPPSCSRHRGAYGPKDSLSHARRLGRDTQSLGRPFLEGYSGVFGGVPISPGMERLVFIQHLDHQLLPYTVGMILAALAADRRTDERRPSMGRPPPALLALDRYALGVPLKDLAERHILSFITALGMLDYPHVANVVLPSLSPQDVHMVTLALAGVKR